MVLLLFLSEPASPEERILALSSSARVRELLLLLPLPLRPYTWSHWCDSDSSRQSSLGWHGGDTQMLSCTGEHRLPAGHGLFWHVGSTTGRHVGCSTFATNSWQK